MIHRKPDWDIRLHLFLEERNDAPFAWGVNDCALFAADAVLAITGADLGAGFRGQYADEAGALAQMTAICGSPDALALAVYLCARAGFAPCPHVNFAQRGDVVVLKNADGTHSLGIVGFNGLHALFVTEGGLRRMKAADCVAAWRVGA